MADPETGFQIGDRVYPLPGLETLDMRERRVMYDYCALVQEDFVQLEDESDDEHDDRVGRLTRHPGFMQALMHIAYQRGNEKLSEQKVRAVVDRTRFVDAVETLGSGDDEAGEGDAGPPDKGSPSTPDESSLKKNGSSSEGSGLLSPTGSDEPGSESATTGTPRSLTSAMSDPVRSGF